MNRIIADIFKNSQTFKACRLKLIKLHRMRFFHVNFEIFSRWKLTIAMICNTFVLFFDLWTDVGIFFCWLWDLYGCLLSIWTFADMSLESWFATKTCSTHITAVFYIVVHVEMKFQCIWLYKGLWTQMTLEWFDVVVDLKCFVFISYLIQFNNINLFTLLCRIKSPEKLNCFPQVSHLCLFSALFWCTTRCEFNLRLFLNTFPQYWQTSSRSSRCTSLKWNWKYDL